MDINSPIKNDNRNYDYAGFPEEHRTEYDVICSMIPANAKVLDLGCGNGSLLKLLSEKKNISACGIELSDSGVEICLKKGLNVSKGRIDESLPHSNKEFDYSICNVTLQMTMFPEKLLSEMSRVSKYQIISFPNFGFYKNRLDMLLFGKMPRPMLFEYKWYSTGHIHQLSISDFEEYISESKVMKILSICYSDTLMGWKGVLQKAFPELFHILPIYLLTSE